MFFLIIFLICIFITVGVGVLASVSDIRTLTIPNAYSAYVAAAFVFAYLVLWAGGHADVFAPVVSHVISAAVTFLVTFALFGLRMIGAADSKFATVCALWIGAKTLPVFLFFMTLAGAGLAVVALILQRRKPFTAPRAGGWVDQVQGGASKVPYGIAITTGMVIAFIYAGYFSPDVMSSFLVTADMESGS
jgi:prepilin peptidase CpaA